MYNIIGELFESDYFPGSKSGNASNTVSSLVANSTFVGIGYGLEKFGSQIDKVGNLSNFQIQNYHPNTKYDYIAKSGITDGKVYMEGTKSSTNNLKYLGTAAKYAGYGAAFYSLTMSYDDYLNGKIPGSIMLTDIGMTVVSFQGSKGAVISAFYFMAVRTKSDSFQHKPIDFNELRKVQIDNTRVRN